MSIQVRVEGPIRIWLDDSLIRRVPDGWIHVTNFDECVDTIMAHPGQLVAISLDRDLCDVRFDPYPHEVTGEEVVKWMVLAKILPKYIFIHSMNFSGAQRMAKDFADAGAKSEIWPYSDSLVDFLSDPENTKE